MGKNREGRYKGKSRAADITETHSLIANVLPIIIISKVFPFQQPSRLNEGSDTSEHHMPGVPAQSGTTSFNPGHIYILYTSIVHVCPSVYHRHSSQCMQSEHLQV